MDCIFPKVLVRGLKNALYENLPKITERIKTIRNSSIRICITSPCFLLLWLREKPIKGEKTLNLVTFSFFLSQAVLEKSGNREVIAHDKYARNFIFRIAFGSNADHEEVLGAVAAPFVEDVLKGYTCNAFLYGHSNSGKFEAMFGTDNVSRCSS